MSQPLRALVGRDDEVARAVQAISEGGVVQLLGPPGVGKSAIRREVVARLEASSWRVLEPSDPEATDLVGSLLDALNVGPVVHRLQALSFALASVPSLVTLDGVRDEDAVALIAALSPLARTVRFLVVSRRALAIQEAHRLEVGPLSFEHASQLFVSRARAITSQPLGDDTGPSITSIVHSTGGLPLAIELAAARLRALSPQSLATRLNDERDRMLERVVEHALEHATAGEVQALAALATFRGTFSSDDAEAILSAIAPNQDVEATLAALRDQSLVHRHADGAFFIAAPIRLHAMRAAGPEAMEQARLFHAAAIAGSERPGLEDVRAALAVAVDPTVLARLAANLGERLQSISVSAADLGLLERAHGVGSKGPEGRAIAAVLADARARALAPDAIDAFRALVRICETEGDERGAGRALSGLGEQHFRSFRMVDARVTWERARARLTAVRDMAGALHATCRLAALHNSTGQLREAEALAEAAAGEAIRLGDASALAEVSATRGTIALQRGEFSAAVRHYEHSAERARALSMRSLLAASCGYGALAHLADGAAAEAADLATTAIDQARAIGYVPAIGYFTVVRAAAWAELDRLDDAKREAPMGLSLLDGVYATVGDLLVGLVDLADVRAAMTLGEQERAFSRAMHLTRRIADVRALSVGPGRTADRPRAIEVSDDLRVVLALVERRTEALAFRERMMRRVAPRDAVARLVLAPGAPRFRLNGRTVTLSHRALLARLLWRLAQRSLEGHPSTSEELVAAGWPDERLPSHVGKTRLYVALAELRKLGLRDVLQSQPDGYALVAEIEIDFSLS